MADNELHREIEIAASPSTVFEVITSPKHLAQWWPDEATLEPVPGAIGQLVFGDHSSGTAQTPEVTVMDVVPGRLFSFRWLYPESESARQGNSLLVTFELFPHNGGTLLRMTERGFHERVTDVEELEQLFREHEAGWDRFLPQLVTYAPTAGIPK